MKDIYINNIGIIFINKNSKYNTTYLNDKDKFNKNKINILQKQKKELLNENNLIKLQFKYYIKNWSINHSSSNKFIHKFLVEKSIIENLLKFNKKSIKNIDNTINSLTNK